MSYFGWDGRVDFDTAYDHSCVASDVLKHADIDEDLLIDMNDSGMSFDEIADNLDRIDDIAGLIDVNQIFQDNSCRPVLRLTRQNNF